MSAGEDSLTSFLQRDRLIVAAALAIVTLLAWAYVVHLGDSMAMSDADMPAMGMHAWTIADFAFMFAMWSVMMVGMMTPSVAPMVLLYAGVGRRAVQQGTAFASVFWFFAGYIAGWVGFSALATLAQFGLTRLALLTPMLSAASTRLAGGLLIAAGLYQWTPLKDSCLRQCQAPLQFLMSHGGFRGDAGGALRLGLRHSAYCLGCCAVLMALLFVGGVMNILWIAGLTMLILAEKLLPAAWFIPKLAGGALVLAGGWLLVCPSCT